MQVKGLDKVNRWLSTDIDTSVGRVMNEAGQEVLQSAKGKVHVDSGDLKDSLNMSVVKDGDKWVIKVGSSLDYSVFEEFGCGQGVFIVSNGEMYTFTSEDQAYASQFKTENNRVIRYAHPYLHPAVFEKRQELVKRLTEEINKGFRV